MKMMVTSGLHKGKIGKVAREVESAYELEVAKGKPEIIVHKTRCKEYQVGMEAEYFKEAAQKSKVIPLFG